MGGGSGTPVINQCFEEAIQRCLELAQVATETAAAAGSVLGEATDVAATLASPEAAALHQAYLDALAAAEQLRKGLEAEEKDASYALEELVDAADAAATTIVQLLGSVRADANRLAELRGRLQANLEVEADRCDSAFDDLAQAVAAFRQGLEASLAEASALLAALRSKVERVRDDLLAGRDELTSAMGRLSTTAMDLTRELTQHVHEAVGVLGREVVDFCNAVIQRHNDAVLALQRGFTSDDSSADPDGAAVPAAGWMGGFLGEVWTAAAELESVGAFAHEALTTVAEDLAQHTGSAAEKCQGIAEAVGRFLPVSGPRSE